VVECKAPMSLIPSTVKHLCLCNSVTVRSKLLCIYNLNEPYNNCHFLELHLCKIKKVLSKQIFCCYCFFDCNSTVKRMTCLEKELLISKQGKLFALLVLLRLLPQVFPRQNQYPCSALSCCLYFIIKA
jgi:hypothetical protein